MDTSKDIITIEFGNENIPKPYESKNTSAGTTVLWGMDNLYPNFLLGLYNSSAVHQAIVNQKSTYLIGGGITLNDQLIDQKLMVNSSDSLNEFAGKIIKDYLLFNAFAVEVCFNVFNQPISYHHIPIHKLRMNKAKTKFFYSDDWSYTRKYIEYDRYNQNVKQEKPTSKIFYYDGYFPSINNVYPTPEYQASIKAIVTDAAISEFNLNNIQNHFSISTIITFFNGSNVSEQVKKSVIDEINEKFRGQSGKKFIVDFQHKDGKPAEVKSLSSGDWDKAYIEVNNRNIDNIMIGHQVQNPSLFGIKTSGQLGSSTELQASYEMFKNNYISVKRNEILTGLNSLFQNSTIIKGTLNMTDKPLFSTTISDATREKIYTIDELRIIDGKEPLPNGEGNKLIGSPTTISTTPIIPQAQETNEPVIHNDAIKNLSGRQYQNVMRIVRNYSNGKLTKEQASIMLSSGFGFNTDEINLFLGINDDEEIDSNFISEEKKNFRILTEEDFEKIAHFGDDENNYEVLFSEKFDRQSDISEFLIGLDIENTRLSILQTKIKEELGYDISQDKLNKILVDLKNSGVLNYSEKEGKIRIFPSKSPSKEADTVTTMYKYVKRPEVPGGDLIKTSRGFCVKLIENNRLYLRSEIQQMSLIFGYDVFKFAGGYYHNPSTDETTPYCRHTWEKLKVKRK